MINGQWNSKIIRKYFKNGCLGRKDLLLAALNKKLPYHLHARKIAALIEAEISEEKNNTEAITIHLEAYSGNNPFAHKITEYLEQNLKNEILGAYAHGSVGTGEEVAYSDFDAFIVLRNKAVTTASSLKRVAWHLQESEKIMTAMDPLQHHGWFILTETDLQSYPEDYLPHQLWQYAKVLTGKRELTIHLKKSGFQSEFIRTYHSFARHLLINIRSRHFLENYYDLKSMLSGFMLLPSIYLQAVSGKAVFKKFSFDMLRKEIGSAYSIMDDVSSLRANWNYKPTTAYLRLLNRKPFLKTYLYKKKLSGKLAPELSETFNEDFIQRMESFILLLNNRMDS